MKYISDTTLIQNYIKKYKLDKWFNKLEPNDMKIIRFNRGEYLARSGEPLDHFMFFVRGRAKIYTVMENGKSYLLSFYEPMQVIGDVELMNDPKMGCNCHVEALIECDCLAIPMELMVDKFFEDTSFLRAVGKSLAIKTYQESMASSVNLLYTLESRLAAYILALAIDKSEVILDESYSDMADLLGTSYRHLARVMNKFVEDGLISKSKKSILILDQDGMQDHAGELILFREQNRFSLSDLTNLPDNE